VARTKAAKSSRRKPAPTSDPVEGNRFFDMGQKVKIAKKSRVVDKERLNEGLSPDDRVPIDQDVTGVEGEVCAPSYYNAKRGEYLIPVRLPNEAIVCVPEQRLEKTGLKKARNLTEGGQSSPSPVTTENIEFWKQYFRDQEIDPTKD
jgi:hypothetical protein